MRSIRTVSARSIVSGPSAAGPAIASIAPITAIARGAIASITPIAAITVSAIAVPGRCRA